MSENISINEPKTDEHQSKSDNTLSRRKMLPKISVPKGITILEAAKQAGIDVPTLCFLKDINEIGDCRMCVVKVEGRRGFATSCIQKVEEGMVIKTHSPEILEARKIILDLILSNHHKDCLTCSRNGNCELQNLAINVWRRKANSALRLRFSTHPDSVG